MTSGGFEVADTEFAYLIFSVVDTNLELARSIWFVDPFDATELISLRELK
jgi:hypothetical protein